MKNAAAGETGDWGARTAAPSTRMVCIPPLPIVIIFTRNLPYTAMPCKEHVVPIASPASVMTGAMGFVARLIQLTTGRGT